MKKSLPFFSLPAFSHSVLFNLSTMNLFSTPRWAVALLLWTAFLANPFSATAQPCVLQYNTPYTAANPPLIVADLNFLTGTVQLNGPLIASSGFFTSDCPLDAASVSFFTDAAATIAAPLSLNCANVGPVFSYWITVNPGGLRSVNNPPLQVNIQVRDITPPLVNCPASITVNTSLDGAGNCSVTGVSGLALTLLVPPPNTPGPGQYFDNCPGPTVTWNITNGIISSAGSGLNAGLGTFTPGTNIVTYTVTDASNRTATCTVPVSVVDDERPTFSFCPPSVTRNPPLGSCSYTYGVGDPMATAVDNCVAPPTITYTLTGANPAGPVNSLAGLVFNNIGATTVSAVATAGALSSLVPCVFSINIVDNQPPAVTCPANVTISTDDNIVGMMICHATLTNVYDLTATTATDNCTPFASLTRAWAITGPIPAMPAASGSNTLAGTMLGLGANVVTWTVTDANGLVNTCSQTITVADQVKPDVEFYFLDSYVVNANTTACSQTVTIEQPNAALLTGTGFNFLASDGCTASPLTLERGTAVVNGVPDPAFFDGVPAFFPDEPLDRFRSLQFPVGITVIPYIWKDAAGNETRVNVTITVNENIPPIARCRPGTTTVALNAAVPALAMPTADQINNPSDPSTDNCGIASYTFAPASFTCAQVGTQTVTMTVTDRAGNTGTCTATIQVVDNTPPQVLCPNNQSPSSNNGCQANNLGTLLSLTQVANNVTLTPGTYRDNCGATVNWAVTGATTTSGTGPIPNTLGFNAGINNLTYTIVDAAGGSVVCNVTVDVDDLQAPVFSNVPANITVNANNGGCQAQVTWTLPTVTETCSLPLGPVTSNRQPGEFFNFGTTVVNYSATDAAGNVGTASFTVTVIDNQPPIVRCQNFSVNLSNSGTATITTADVNDAALTRDNCSFNLSLSKTAFDCSNLGANVVVLTATDGQGNSSSCTATVTINDNIPPTAVCAALTNIDLGANCSLVFNASTLNNNSLDNCANPALAVAIGAGDFASSLTLTSANLGAQTLRLRVTDAAGNSSTCSQAVTVRDVTPPVFTLTTVPQNATVECSAIPPVVNPQATDACDNAPTVVLVSAVSTLTPATQCNYTITRMWRASDASGNSTMVSQVLTVQDRTAPVFDANFPDEVEIDTDVAENCFINYNLKIATADLTDNCTGISGVSYKIQYDPRAQEPDVTGVMDMPIPARASYRMPKDTIFPIGTSTITLTASDGCGNSVTQVIEITVVDTQGPIFFGSFATTYCGKTFNLNNTPGACANVFSWPRPNAAFNPAVDDCSLPFRVSESYSDASVGASINQVNAFNYNTPTLFQATANAQFPIGSTVVSYTATDNEGNSSTCSFTVTITDNQPPVINCPQPQVLSSTCAEAKMPDYRTLAAISDNCPKDTSLTIQTPAAGTLLSAIPGLVLVNNTVLPVKIRVVDKNSTNATECTFNVTLRDGQQPIPTLAALPDITNRCGGDTIPAPTASDPCNANAQLIYGTPSVPVGSILNTTPPSYLLNIGEYVITWSYNDGNNNVATQPQNVRMLADNFPPIARCKYPQSAPLVVALDTAGKASITPQMVNDGSNDPDNCGIIGLELSKTDFTCADINLGTTTTTVTLTVKDQTRLRTGGTGNPATCTAHIVVRDVIAPTLIGAPRDTTVAACSPAIAAPTLRAIDRCDLNVVPVLAETSTQTQTGFGKYNYQITRFWTATDDSGNTASSAQVITVQDVQKPVFAATMPATVNAVTGNTCAGPVTFNAATFVTDCATGTDLTITNRALENPTNFAIPAGADIGGTYPIGVYRIEFTATDISGNSSSAIVVVDVKDATPPVAVCINGVSASVQPSGNVTVRFEQFNNNSSDNCTATPELDLTIQRLNVTVPAAPTPTITFACVDADGKTQHPIRLYVKDKVGNQSTCETYIVIQDNVAPVITICPPARDVACSVDLSPATQGSALAIDNCASNLQITFTDLRTPRTEGNCSILTRTWRASDLAGNSASCSQVITVTDNILPTFSVLPPSATIKCSDNLVNAPNVTATDNCGTAPRVALRTDTINRADGVCGKYSYSVRRTWTATDDCGNSSVHIQVINVEDKDAPQFLGMPAKVQVFTANTPNNTACSAQVNFNIGQFLTDCAPDGEIIVSNSAPRGNNPLDVSGVYPIGTQTIVFTATDPCGNSSSSAVVIEVIDNSVPTAICNRNVSITLGTNGNATLLATEIDLGSTDNCGVTSRVLSKSTFDCSNLGLNLVSLNVTDAAGNSNSCAVNVTVSPGNGSGGFGLTATGTPTSTFGAADGTARAVATGGTGTFRYAWSNQATTANISNLRPGVYTITVTDTGSGCIQVDTAVVGQGGRIKITIGRGAGLQDQVIKIPVTVERFTDIKAFSFTLNVTTPAVASITGISDQNPALTGIQSNVVGSNIGIIWTDPAAQKKTLASGALLFNLMVKIGTAPNGSITPITIGGTPTVIEILQDSAGVSRSRPLEVMDGQVTVGQGPNTATVAGKITTWKNPENAASVARNMPRVPVTLGGFSATPVNTDTMGNYRFANVPLNTNTITTATKSTPGNAGITAGDLLRIVNHIFGEAFPSPYQWVAGDINSDKKITLADYLLIQRVALGTDQNLQGSPDWVFVPKSYAFPTTGEFGPLTNPVPLSIPHAPVSQDYLEDDFIGVRKGDVNGNAPTNNAVGADDRYEDADALRFRVTEQSVRAGEMVEVAFKASDFRNRRAYQMTIAFDPTVLALDNIVPGELPGLTLENFGAAHLSDGHLTTVWANRQAVDLTNDATLFTLRFRALRGKAALSQVLRAGSEVTRAEAIDADGRTQRVDFDFVKPENGQDAAPFALYQNQPNPFEGNTRVGFRLPESGRATLRVFNSAGQVVKLVTGNFERGYNELMFQQSDLGAAGVYWYELETPTHSDRKKMIIIE